VGTLILAGGGHAHLEVMAGLTEITGRGHRVLLINPEPYHYYSGMGPGLLGGSYRPDEVRFHVRQLVEARGGTFVQGRVARIDAAGRRVVLADGSRHRYDVLSCNTGSGVPLPPVDDGRERIFPVKPISGLWRLRRRLLAELPRGPQRLLVVGGGPAGVETAGNLRQLVTAAGGRADIRLVAGRRGLLPGFPADMRRQVERALQRRDIVVTTARVTRLHPGEAELDDGSRLGFELALVATGVQPAPLYRDSGLAIGPDGALAVNERLQAPEHPEIFGGGDCIHFLPQPLAKVGVYAVRQNPILRHNLRAALEGRALRPFRPQRAYLLILNLGDGDGLLQRSGFSLDGRRAFAIKDWIDRRFMRRFQLCGELAEADGERGG